MGTKLSLLQKSGKGGLGWQTPGPSPEGSTPPEVQRPQARHPQNLNYHRPQSTQKPTLDIQPGKYPTQAKK